MKRGILFFILITCMGGRAVSQKTITSDERMAWWREARYGMFIHWGIYSIPAGEWEGKVYPYPSEWLMRRAPIPVTEYRKVAKEFNPVKFDPKAFVEIAKNAGMKYIVITAKHHDGFAMFKSNASKYNVVDATPYGKDIIKALAEECQRQNMQLGFYYSQAQDWNEPNGYSNDWDFPKERNFQKYLEEKVKPQLTELLTNYGPVCLIWFDTPVKMTYDQAESLKDLVRKLQPACLISGRLGGGVKTDYSNTRDNTIPGEIVSGDWEVPATLNKSWGYKKSDTNWKSWVTVTRLLFDIASKGGNYLLNVGPNAEGVIPEESVAILKRVGDWMEVNGSAIYGSHSSPFPQKFEWGRVTSKFEKLYLGIYNWPENGLDLDGLVNKVKKIYLLADSSKTSIPYTVKYNKAFGQHLMHIDLKGMPPDQAVSVVVVEFKGTPKIESKIVSQE